MTVKNLSTARKVREALERGKRVELFSSLLGKWLRVKSSASIEAISLLLRTGWKFRANDSKET